jgi:hypothetical protein
LRILFRQGAKKRGSKSYPHKRTRGKRVGKALPLREERKMSENETTKQTTRMDAGEIARQRFERYAVEKLGDEWDDTVRWEFWNHMLEQAKSHRLDHSGYGSFEYQADRAKAREELAAAPAVEATVKRAVRSRHF